MGQKERGAVGGMWDVIGPLQFNFLVANGMKPEDYLLDIGCGCLRGGIHAIPYLDSGHYMGCEKYEDRLLAGINDELPPLVFEEKKPQLIVSDSLEFDWCEHTPTFAIAQSVFTHISPEDIRKCMHNLSKFKGLKFFATYFLRNTPKGAVEYAPEDWYHDRSFVKVVGDEAGAKTTIIDKWDHPRDQRMVLYEF